MWRVVPLYGYLAVQLATLFYLVFFDGYRYTWWNWIIAVPVDFGLASFWPLYWLYRIVFG